MNSNEEIKLLKNEIKALRNAFITSLHWIATSANSPLRADEVSKLTKFAMEFEKEK